MLGAITGDIVGSRFEFDNIKTKEFELFTEDCGYTDDSVMSLAIAKALMDSRGEDGKTNKEVLSVNAIISMLEFGDRYPYAGYGGNFYRWLFGEDKRPYGSWGNGAAMRVSACGDAAESLADALSFAEEVTKVTHDHPEGIKGAKATSAAIYLAYRGAGMDGIRSYICENFYDLNFTLDDIRDEYEFNESCQDTVPQAIEAFLESESFEDAIRNAMSIGGDSDTIGAITGAIAEAYYGIPDEIAERALSYLDQYQKDILAEWYRSGAENLKDRKLRII